MMGPRGRSAPGGAWGGAPVTINGYLRLGLQQVGHLMRGLFEHAQLGGEVQDREAFPNSSG
jgi:hypothetical protein